MERRKQIVVIGYNGAQILDIVGPYQVFAAANEELDQPAYDLVFASLDGREAHASCGLTLGATPLSSIDPAAVHTLLVVGGEDADVTRAATSKTLLSFVRAAAARAHRLCSVCTGTFVLAAAGVATGKRVATHWRGTRILQKRFPDLTVDHDSIFVADGQIWSSAGVTTGIDMTLALVEKDLGRKVSLAVARRLVVYACRPGSQSQFSALLQGQDRAGDQFAATVDWMSRNLDQAITVTDAANVAGMSERSFHRKFAEVTGETPARFIETLRLDSARTLLETGDLPLKAIAGQVGLSSPGRLIQTFERRFGLSPTAYRKLHGVC